MPSSSLFRFDKLIHLFIFGMFAWLVLRGLYAYHAVKIQHIKATYLWVACATICFGISIELMQQFIPDRGADIYDVIANTVGILVAQAIFYFAHRTKTA